VLPTELGIERGRELVALENKVLTQITESRSSRAQGFESPSSVSSRSRVELSGMLCIAPGAQEGD
jgi:hypothetical protein